MDSIKHILFAVNSTFSLRDLLFIVPMSIVAGCFIYFSYCISHKNTPPKFLTISIVGFSPIFALLSYWVKIENTIIALVVLIICILAATLAVNRRNAKLEGDQLFLVWSAACGVLCGEKMFEICAVLSIVVFAAFLAANAIRDDKTRVLVITGENIRALEIQAIVFKHFKKKASLLDKKYKDDCTFVLAYRVSTKALNNLRDKRINIVELIEKISGVKTVLVMDEDQYNG